MSWGWQRVGSSVVNTPCHVRCRVQVSAAVSPDNEATNSFRECVIIRHPRRDGEFAFAFITGQTVLQVGGPPAGALCCCAGFDTSLV